MRYMMIVSAPESFAVAGPPPAALVEEIAKLCEEGLANGTLVSFGGLQPTSSGTRLRVTNGKIIAQDGPFTEAKEVVGGFSIFNVASKEAAVEEARRLVELHRRHWPRWEGEIELRRLYEAEDDVRETQIEGSRLVERVTEGGGE